MQLYTGTPPDYSFDKLNPSLYTQLYGFQIQAHEQGHTMQSHVLGPAFLPLYFGSALVNGWNTNPFEINSDVNAKYGIGLPPW